MTTDEHDQLISSNNNHNHQPNPTEIQVKKVVDQMKERAKNETTAILKIYSELYAP